jgi:hypothetical protein
LKLPAKVNDLDLRSLTSAVGLKLPAKVNDFYLRSEVKAEYEKLKQSKGGQ